MKKKNGLGNLHFSPIFSLFFLFNFCPNKKIVRNCIFFLDKNNDPRYPLNPKPQTPPNRLPLKSPDFPLKSTDQWKANKKKIRDSFFPRRESSPPLHLRQHLRTHPVQQAPRPGRQTLPWRGSAQESRADFRFSLSRHAGAF